MEKIHLKLRIKSEIVWYLISAIATAIIIFPLFYFQIEYPFYWNNVLFVFGFFLLFRIIFLLKFTPYAWNLWAKTIISFSMIPLLFWGIISFAEFKDYLNEEGMQMIVDNVTPADQIPLSNYIRNEMVYFSISFIICALIVPFKLIWSIWKQINRNEV